MAVYHLVQKPKKGRGKQYFEPGDFLTRSQALKFLGINYPRLIKLKDNLVNDPAFKRSGHFIFWIRTPRFKTDLQTVYFLYQRLRQEERTLKRIMEEKEQYGKDYYQRELDAYLRGELNTSPKSNKVSFRSLGLDPFESR